MVKNLPVNAGDMDWIGIGSGRSFGKGNGKPLSILAWEIHGQRSLAGYSPWGHKRVGHKLATKQQQYISLVKEFLKICTYIEVILFDSLVQSFTNFLKVNFKYINIYIYCFVIHKYHIQTVLKHVLLNIVWRFSI